MAISGKEEREGVSGDRVGDNIEQQGGGIVYGIYRGINLGYGGGTCTDGIQGGATGGGGHVAVDGTDYQGKK